MGDNIPKPETETSATPLPNLGQGYIAVPWLPLMSQGVGYDSVSHNILPSAAVDEFALVERPQGQGQTGQLRIKQVQTTQEVSSLISAQADLKVGYDVFSSSAIGRFLRERRMNRFSLYFLVLSYMERALVRLQGFRLSAHARRLAATDPAEFRKKYGDYFVEGFIAGGYLIGLAELQVQSEEILTQIQNKIRGKYDSKLVNVDGSVQTAWKDLEKIAGTDFSLQVIHAGVGEGVRAYAITSPGRGSVAPQPPHLEDSRRLPPLTDESRAEAARGGIPDRLMRDSDDEDDLDEGPELGENDAPLPITTHPRGGGGSPGDTEDPGLTPVVNQLDPPADDYLPPLNMNLEGIMQAASALQAQSGKYRVRLLAQLRPYSTLDDGPKSGGDIFFEDLNRKRKLLAEYYSKASYIHDSVRFALASRGQFSAAESDLLKVKKEMEELMDGPNGYAKLWDDLRTDPAKVTYKRIGDGPDERKIPKWATKKETFRPLAQDLDPQLFVNLFREAVTQAAGLGTPEKRQALKEYLKLIQEKIGTNYANAVLVLETMSERFPLLDENPKRREKEIRIIAAMVEKSSRTWTTETNLILDKFKSLDGKWELDQKQLTFLAPLNEVVFGGAEDAKFGMRGFWKKLLDDLNTLVQKSGGWNENQKLGDLVDYTNDWPGLAEAFSASSQELARIRGSLI